MSITIDTINQTSLVPQSLLGLTGNQSININSTNGIVFNNALSNLSATIAWAGISTNNPTGFNIISDLNLNNNNIRNLHTITTNYSPQTPLVLDYGNGSGFSITSGAGSTTITSNNNGILTFTASDKCVFNNTTNIFTDIQLTSLNPTIKYTSNLGVYNSGTNTTTWSITIPNTLGSSFDYRAVISQPPTNIDFASAGQLALQNEVGAIGYWGVSAGVAIYVPYTIGGVAGNGGYVFSSYSHPGFPQLTGLVTTTTTIITGSNTYTTTLQGNWSSQSFTISIIKRL